MTPHIDSKRSAIPAASCCLKGRSGDSFQTATQGRPHRNKGFPGVGADQLAAGRGAKFALTCMRSRRQYPTDAGFGRLGLDDPSPGGAYGPLRDPRGRGDFRSDRRATEPRRSGPTWYPRTLGGKARRDSGELWAQCGRGHLPPASSLRIPLALGAGLILTIRRFRMASERAPRRVEVGERP